MRVINATGLTGVYQFKIDVPIPLGILQMVAPIAARNGDSAQADLNMPVAVSVRKALDNLGLRLVERKAPLDVIVIDAINRTATEN